MTTLVRLICAMLALTLAGCSALRSIEPGESPAVVEVARPDDVERLLSYFARARKMPALEQGRERDGAQQAYLRAQTEYNRVRLAMLLSLPGTAYNDDARALELIDPMARNQQASLHTLAVLLGAYIQEQKRLNGNVQGLQQNLQGLQHKLDALKTLERNLIEREQSGAKKR
jgi:hypothetical protein